MRRKDKVQEMVRMYDITNKRSIRHHHDRTSNVEISMKDIEEGSTETELSLHLRVYSCLSLNSQHLAKGRGGNTPLEYLTSITKDLEEGLMERLTNMIASLNQDNAKLILDALDLASVFIASGYSEKEVKKILLSSKVTRKNLKRAIARLVVLSSVYATDFEVKIPWVNIKKKSILVEGYARILENHSAEELAKISEDKSEITILCHSIISTYINMFRHHGRYTDYSFKETLSVSLDHPIITDFDL